MQDPTFALIPGSARAEPSDKQARRPRRGAHLRLVRQPRRLPALLARRDADFTRRAFPLMAAISDRYFRCEVQGVEHLSDRASMVISTHNGGMYAPDIIGLNIAFMRRFGIETPLYSLTHDMTFKLPFYGAAARKFGAVLATPDNARVVLEHDFPVVICPGGDEDSLKPFSRRHRIRFGNRMGFVRAAIEQQVPIIPVVSVGAHEIFFVLNEGRPVARWLGFDRLLRIKSVPFSLQLPWGLGIAGVGAWPLPSKVRVRVLPPMDLGVPRSAGDDPQAVRAGFDRVVGVMQAALSDLASRRRWPVLG
jgi:1-acyl-sn-glycerol-3-phosphate acyltransferase